MRTTLELPDPIFHKAKRLAQQRGIPFRALVAEALRMLVAKQGNDHAFTLEDASFRGDGLVDGLAEADWESIRDLAYQGRGG